MNRLELCNIYLDWLNNYVSIETFANNYGLYENEAIDLIRLAKSVYIRNHPDN